MVEGVSEHLSWLKRLPALPLAAFHHPLWDYWDTAEAPGAGCSFYSCITLATGLLEEESSVLYVPG